MTKFKATSTADDIISFKGLLDPSSDLEIVSKKEILRYTAHLLSELKSKNRALSELKDSFDRSLCTLKITNIDSIIEPITQKLNSLEPPLAPPADNILNQKLKDIQISIDKINMPSTTDENKVVTTPPSVIEPYLKFTEGFVKDTSLMGDLQKLVEGITDYKSVNGQREVRYYGDYKYKYQGGEHNRDSIPEPVNRLIETITGEYPSDEKGNSCMISKYTDGTNYCPSHSDDEWALSPMANIYTFTIGASRPVEFTEKNGDSKVEVKLDHNSLLVCSRLSQAKWKHAIPPDVNCTGVRYSLTIRVIKPYYLNSTAIIGDSNTRPIKFGDERGCLGKWVPGSRIEAFKIQDIPTPEVIGPHRNVIIHTGINDINCLAPKPDIALEEALESKCMGIHALFPRTKIFLSPILPTKNYYLNIKVCQFNTRIISLAKRHHNIFIINNSSFMDIRTYLLRDVFKSSRHGDIIHLGAQGLRHFASSLKSYAMGKSPLYPTNFTRVLQCAS